MVKVLWNSSDLELRSGMVLEINEKSKKFSARVPYGFNEKNYLISANLSKNYSV